VSKQRVPKPAAIALVVVALLVAAALGYFAVISPKRSASADLAAQIEATETEIQNRRLASRSAPKAEPIRAADLFRVTKAMPGKADMPGVLLELNRIARETGIRFDSITPGDSADAGGYLRQPIDVIFEGSFYELSDFLYRVRTLVSVHNGRLRATGRLFTVRTLSFVESEQGFPQIKATLGVDAYVYGTGAATPPAAPPPAAQPPAAQPPAAQPPAAQPPAAQPPAAQPPAAAPPAGASAAGAS
jgi:Tfp pilus assembly protein PilO